MATLEQLERALHAADAAGDEDAARQLAAEYQSESTRVAASRPRAVASAGAAGAPDRGGSTGTANDVPNLRTAGAVAAMAPARAVGGLADLGYAGGRWAGEKTGLVDPKEERSKNLTPKIEALTNELAGQPVGQGMGRAVAEGVMTAPMAGGSKLAGMVAGGFGAGASELAAEHNLPWWAQLGLGVSVGGVAGKATDLARMRPSETLSRSRLANSVKGITEDELRAAQRNLDSADASGLKLMPSQSLENGQGLEKLQAALMDSKSKGSEDFLRRAYEVPGKVKEMVAQLKSRSGQNPRDEALMAESIQDIAAREAKSGSQAVNAATAADYAAARAPGVPTFGAANIPKLRQLFSSASRDAIDDPTAQALLSKSQSAIEAALQQGVKPDKLVSLVSNLKRDLPAGTEVATSATNRVRGILDDVLNQVRDQAEAAAPSLKTARQTQAELRQDLPGKFDEVTRMAKRGGGPTPALNFAADSPELLGAVGKADARLAQELVQRRLNQTADKALESNRPGTVAQRELSGAPGLEHLTGESGANQLRQALEAMRMGDRPTGATANAATFTPLAGENAARNTTRGLTGQIDYLAGTVGRLVAGTGLRISDSAAIKVLSRPDAMERLAYLKSLPPGNNLRAAALATFPDLFEEQK